MGDRRMAELKVQKGSLFVYVHWHGEALPDMAKAAIAKAQPRWGDEPYATRIIVDQLTKDGRDEENSFGLMVAPDAEDEYNNDVPSVIIDLPAQTLTVYDHDTDNQQYTFQELMNRVTTT